MTLRTRIGNRPVLIHCSQLGFGPDIVWSGTFRDLPWDDTWYAADLGDLLRRLQIEVEADASITRCPLCGLDGPCRHGNPPAVAF